MLSCSIVGKFLSEPFSHKLFACPTTFGTDLDSLDPDVFTNSLQEPSGKRLVLPIFTQDDYLDIPAH